MAILNDDLSGTKEIIFDAALELFANKGYDNVSMREIAESSNIKHVASLYYYFKNKEQILDYMFKYLTDHFFDNIMNADEVMELCNTGTYLDLLNAASWEFNGSPKEKKRMTLILKIVYMRILLCDEKANKLFTELIIGENKKRAIKILEYGVSIGKLDPDLDVESFFYTLLYTRLFAGIVGLTGYYTGGEVNRQLYLNKFLAQLLEGYHKNNGIK